MLPARGLFFLSLCLYDTGWLWLPCIEIIYYRLPCEIKTAKGKLCMSLLGVPLLQKPIEVGFGCLELCHKRAGVSKTMIPTIIHSHSRICTSSIHLDTNISPVLTIENRSITWASSVPLSTSGQAITGCLSRALLLPSPT